MEDDSAEFDPPTLDLPAGGQRVSESSVSARKLPLPHQDWDRYQIVGFIGSGGMATVYKARDPRLNRFVALKFIRPSDTESELGQRFYREARAQAGIEHEHICKIYEVGEVDGRAYIAMQYIEGETLTTARGKMTTEQKVRVLEQVADALHSAHRMGLIHRDVKPGNIMVEPTPEGGFRPYVLDFGLASEVQTSGPSGGGNREGTPAYMAPEQARGDTQTIDRRTDVYGLGSTLYDILTGQPPYGIRTTEDTLLALLIEAPKPLRHIRREALGTWRGRSNAVRRRATSVHPGRALCGIECSQRCCWSSDWLHPQPRSCSRRTWRWSIRSVMSSVLRSKRHPRSWRRSLSSSIRICWSQ